MGILQLWAVLIAGLESSKEESSTGREYTSPWGLDWDQSWSFLTGAAISTDIESL